MKTVRIGVYDEELEYVDMLCSYLRSCGKGRWNLSGFTKKELLTGNRNAFDILISTNMEVFDDFSNQMETLDCIYLSSSQDEKLKSDICAVYRFQNAREIANAIRHIIHSKKKTMTKQYIAIYSPVGRCGKTGLAYGISKENRYGKWLYVGMEDYSSFETYSDTGEILYYIKERNEERIHYLLEQSEDILIVAQGALELKQMNEDDMKWFCSVLEKSAYIGFVFDVGNGLTEGFQLFTYFDWIFVPALSDEYSRIKTENFKKNLYLYSIENLEEKMIYLNMDNLSEVEAILNEKLLTGEDG